MAEPARRPDAVEEPPLPDPIAVERAYRFHKTRRRIRQERKQERALARLRFFAVLLALSCSRPTSRSSCGGRSSSSSASVADADHRDTSRRWSRPRPIPPEAYEPDETPDRFAPDAAWVWGAGERLTWLAGMVLALSTLMGWYVNSSGDRRSP